MAKKEDNLIPAAHKLSVEEQSRGGKNSVIARRAKKDLKQALEILLEKEYTDRNGNTLSGTEAIATKLFEQAMKGNIKAFEMVRDTTGQKPIEKVMLTEVEQDVIDEVEAMVKDKRSQYGKHDKKRGS